MNRIVKKHYPASRLPAELREGIRSDALVTVSISDESSATAREAARPFSEIFEEITDRRVLSDDAVERVRALRDEWSEREAEIERIRRSFKD